MTLLRINDLINITGFSRPTITKLLKIIAEKGSNNSIYNSELKLYGVRDIDKFFEELNFINKEREIECQSRDYIKEVKYTGSLIPKEESSISNQLRKEIFRER